MSLFQPFTKFMIRGTEQLFLCCLKLLLDNLSQIREISGGLCDPLPKLITEALLIKIRGGMLWDQGNHGL